MARPFVANTLLGIAPFSADDPSGLVRQSFNEASAETSERFVADLQRSLAFQDSLDGRCGNQVLAEPKAAPSRYRALAKTFADDRLWVNAATSVCTQFFAVELAKLTGDQTSSSDCGGRAPVFPAMMGALVKLTNLEHDSSPLEVMLTDHDGRASFTMPSSGRWLLNVIWTRPLPASEETDFETVFSSLSFGFPSDRS
ncbi:MAG TPA: hypothetical protein VH062_32125 [Polyangiaceae bacterium]|nr:hypothetical protein [Polyangiaceae bacterium]